MDPDIIEYVIDPAPVLALTENDELRCVKSLPMDPEAVFHITAG